MFSVRYVRLFIYLSSEPHSTSGFPLSVPYNHTPSPTCCSYQKAAAAKPRKLLKSFFGNRGAPDGKYFLSFNLCCCVFWWRFTSISHFDVAFSVMLRIATSHVNIFADIYFWQFFYSVSASVLSLNIINSLIPILVG